MGAYKFDRVFTMSQFISRGCAGPDYFVLFTGAQRVTSGDYPGSCGGAVHQCWCQALQPGIRNNGIIQDLRKEDC